MLATGVTSTKRSVNQSSQFIPSDLEARALLQVESLERKLIQTQKKGDLLEESRLCNNIAKKYELILQWRKALLFHAHDRQISEAIADYEGMAMAIDNMGKLFEKMELHDLAMRYYEEQLQIGKKRKLVPEMFNALVSMASLKLRVDDKLPEVIRDNCIHEGISFLVRANETLENYAKAIEEGLLSRERLDKVQAMRLTLRLCNGHLHHAKGESDTALGNFQSCVEGFREIGDNERLFTSLGYLGGCLERSKNYREAVETCYDRQLELARQNKDITKEALALCNLGRCYQKLNDFELAEGTFYLHKDIVYTNYSDQGELKRADELVTENAKLRDADAEASRIERISDPSAANLYKLAKNLMTLDQTEEALARLRTAWQVISETRDASAITLQRKILKSASELSVQLGNEADAIYFIAKYREIAKEGQNFIESRKILAKASLKFGRLSPEVVDELWNAMSVHDPDTEDRILLLNYLSLCCEALGRNEEAFEYKNECLSLFTAHNLSLKEREMIDIEQELADVDYFANRKASKTVMKFVDGQFNMKSRAKGTRGLEVGRGTRTVKNNNAKPKSVGRKPKSRVIYEDDGFIDDDAAKDGTSSFKPMPIVSIDSDHYDSLPEPLPWPPSPKKTRRIEPDNQSAKSSTSSRTWSNHDPSHVASILRITVKVGEWKVVIPVVDDITERKRISWLVEEAVHRYLADNNREPILNGLYNEDGAKLVSGDFASLVLYDGQTVEARVLGFKAKNLADIFRKKCLLKNAIIDSEVEARLAKVDDEIDPSSLFLTSPHLELLCESIFEYVETRATFSRLSFSGLNIYDSHVFEKFPVCPSLTHLDISYTFISKCAWIASKCPNLEHLNLSFCQVPDLFELLKEMVSREHPIKELNMSGCMLSNCRMEDLYLLPALSDLDLSFCPIDFVLARGIGKLLKLSNCIKHLCLNGCFIDDGYLDPVLEGLQKNVSLRTFDIKGSSLSAGMMEILYKIGESKGIVINSN